MARCPDTTDAVTNQKSTIFVSQSTPTSDDSVEWRKLHESSAHGADLYHCGDIGFDVCLLDGAVRAVVDGLLEILRAECAADESFVYTTGGAHEAEGEDGKPEAPVEHLGWIIKVLEFEDVNGFLDAACHSEGWDEVG